MDENTPQELVEAGRGYESLFVPALFEHWTKHLIEGAGIREGSHLLDIACGTGILARDAFSRTGPGGRVVGADPAPGMLATANEIEPSIDWILCSAEFMEAQWAICCEFAVMSQIGQGATHVVTDPYLLHRKLLFVLSLCVCQHSPIPA